MFRLTNFFLRIFPNRKTETPKHVRVRSSVEFDMPRMPKFRFLVKKIFWTQKKIQFHSKTFETKMSLTSFNSIYIFLATLVTNISTDNAWRESRDSLVVLSAR